MVDKIQCDIDLYRDWERHPFTSVLKQLLKTDYIDNAINLSSHTNIDNLERIGLKMAHVNGVQKVLFSIFDKETLDDYLEENVQWSNKESEEDSNHKLENKPLRISPK